MLKHKNKVKNKKNVKRNIETENCMQLPTINRTTFDWKQNYWVSRFEIDLNILISDCLFQFRIDSKLKNVIEFIFGEL